MRAARLASALFVAAIASCQATEPAKPAEVPSDQPIKSPNDDREYRYVVLPNRLRALLIHAPDSDRAAAAVSVARGSDHDPHEHPGLAHFVEHMLFIATDKYPEVDGFTEFMGKNGGSRSAYTASGRTTYYFSIKQNRLPEALDRFAQFFIAPTFDPEYTEREKESVQAEYQVQFKQDNWRAHAVHRRLLDPEYPGSRFNIGSVESLRNAGVAEVRAFFEANYSADIITAAVLGPQDLDTLETLVNERFALVEDRDLGPRPANPPLYERGFLPASYAWRTVKDQRSLTFRFPVPPLRPHYDTKPAYHLASLIGHEGRGSLHELLSQRGWIESLAASRYSYDERNSVFSIAVGLTEAGSSRVDEIVDLTYAWLSLIRRHGLAPWRYAEDARRRELRFRFQEEGSVTNAVIGAAEGLADYPPEDVLRAPYLMESFDEALLHRYLDHLTPDNSLVSLAGPDIEGDRVEPVFDVTWRAGPGVLPSDVDAPLELPEPNPYLPEDLGLAFEPGPPATPVEVDTGTAVETWHAPDTEFRTPTARATLTVRPAEPFGPEDVVLASIYAELVKDAMNAEAYDARRAGLAYAVDATWTGFSIAVSGYHDKLGVLFDEALDAFLTTAIDPEKVAVARQQLAKVYANLALDYPYQRVTVVLSRLLHPHAWPVEPRLDALGRVTPETMATWREKQLAGMAATLFVHGNLREDDARELAGLVQERLGIANLPHELPRAKHVDRSRSYDVVVDHDDAAYALYIQGATESVEEHARVGLIGRMLSGRYYTALRTERQLGYVVQAYSNPIARRAGLVFRVQASKIGATEIEAFTNAFLEEQRAWFRTLSKDELEVRKSGYIAALTRADRNNYRRASRLLGDLARRVLTFDHAQQVADAVARLEPSDVADAYDALIDPASGNRLTVFSRGKPGTAPTDGEPITSIMAFKRGEDAPP